MSGDNHKPKGEIMNKEFIYHTSPGPITKIDDGKNSARLFGSHLFFADDPYWMGNPSEEEKTYRMPVGRGEILDVSQLGDLDADDRKKIEPYLKRVMKKFKVDEETAEDLLSERQTMMDLVDEDGFLRAGLSYDMNWDLQHIQALAAKALGYKGAAMRDEQGRSYLIDMMGQEHMLEDVGDEWEDREREEDPNEIYKKLLLAHMDRSGRQIPS